MTTGGLELQGVDNSILEPTKPARVLCLPGEFRGHMPTLDDDLRREITQEVLRERVKNVLEK